MANFSLQLSRYSRVCERSGMSSGLTTVDPSPAPSLNGLDASDRVQTMVDWFNENFEDPAQETPYESAEGGYIFIWGGPYDARDELDSFFPEASEEEVDRAVDAIEVGGLSIWAPAGSRIQPEFDPEDEPDAPTLQERLRDLRQQLVEVESGIKALPARASMMGHNRPPEEFRDYLAQWEKDEALQSIKEVRAELDKAEPDLSADVETIQRAEGRLRNIAIKLWGWIKGLGATAAKAAAGEAGRELIQDPTALAAKIETAVSTLHAWGHVLGNSF